MSSCKWPSARPTPARSPRLGGPSPRRSRRARRSSLSPEILRSHSWHPWTIAWVGTGEPEYRRASVGDTTSVRPRQIHVQPRHRAGVIGADLHEIAQLVYQPQASPGELLGARAHTAGERHFDAARILHLTQQRLALLPHSQPAGAPAVAHAVAG